MDLVQNDLITISEISSEKYYMHKSKWHNVHERLACGLHGVCLLNLGTSHTAQTLVPLL